MRGFFLVTLAKSAPKNGTGSRAAQIIRPARRQRRAAPARPQGGRYRAHHGRPLPSSG